MFSLYGKIYVLIGMSDKQRKCACVEFIIMHNELMRIISFELPYINKIKGVFSMMYPYMVLADGTEIVHSQIIEEDGLKQ